MGKAARKTINIISHGPSCLDGVAAAAAIARFYRGQRVVPMFPGNSDSDKTIMELSLDSAAEREIWITDLSWNQMETREHLEDLAAGGAQLYWIDHHRTAVGRAGAPEFQIRFTGKVLSEEFSAAKLVYDFLARRTDAVSNDPEGFRDFAPVVALADDHDRWVHKIPDSPDWALAVQTLGSHASFREMLRMREGRMPPRLRQALEAGRQGMRQSLELAKATITDTNLSSGYKLRTACCFGYNSEVASELYRDQHNTIIGLFDMRSRGVSLRRSADCDADLSAIARELGGGGHAAAAGFELAELNGALATELNRILTARIGKSNNKRIISGA